MGRSPEDMMFNGLRSDSAAKAFAGYALDPGRRCRVCDSIRVKHDEDDRCAIPDEKH